MKQIFSLLRLSASIKKVPDFVQKMQLAVKSKMELIKHNIIFM